LHQRRKKYILDQMCGFVAQYCGLLTFWNTSQLLLLCYSTETRWAM
jgi:hypothetical protein